MMGVVMVVVVVVVVLVVVALVMVVLVVVVIIFPYLQSKYHFARRIGLEVKDFTQKQQQQFSIINFCRFHLRA